MAANPSADNSCDQLKSSSFHPLSLANTNNACALCKDNSTHFLTANQCSSRTSNLLEYLGCGGKKTDADKCESCVPGQRPFRVANESICIENSMSSNLNIQTTINNCKTRSLLAPFECVLCEQNFALKRASTPNASGLITSCELISGLIPAQEIVQLVSFSPNLTLSGPRVVSVTNYPSSCDLLGVSSKSVSVCSSCLSSAPIRVVLGYSPSSGPKPSLAFTNIHPETKINEFFPSFPAIQACLDSFDKFVKKTNKIEYMTNSADCLFAKQLSGDSGLVCLRCSNGKAAKVFTAEEDKEGFSFGFQENYTVGDCSSCPKNFTSKFVGLYSHVPLSYSSTGADFLPI